jgi:carboxylesterase type B
MIVAAAPSAWAAISDPVKIETGQLSGASTGTPSVRVFRGIPFAAPPTGENRWRAPQACRQVGRRSRRGCVRRALCR